MVHVVLVCRSSLSCRSIISVSDRFAGYRRETPLICFAVMIKGASGHFLDLTNAELGDLAWLAGGIYIEQNRFPNTVFPRQCFLLIEDDDVRNKVSSRVMLAFRNPRRDWSLFAHRQRRRAALFAGVSKAGYMTSDSRQSILCLGWSSSSPSTSHQIKTDAHHAYGNCETRN